jgi:hypothetical protein
MGFRLDGMFCPSEKIRSWWRKLRKLNMLREDITLEMVRVSATTPGSSDGSGAAGNAASCLG